MTASIVVLYSLLLIQYAFAQCIGTRPDGLASIPNIPVEYLALSNYGAMDYLSSPIIETIRPYVLNTFPIASPPEVISENPFIGAIPYATNALNIEAANLNRFPAFFEAPYAVNQNALPVPFLTEVPTANLNPLSLEVPFNTNNLYNAPYELNPFVYKSPYPLSPLTTLTPTTVEVPLALETPVLANTYSTIAPLTYEVPYFNNIPNNITPLITTPLGISAAEAIASPSIFSEIFSRIASFTPSTNVKCLGGYGANNLAASRCGGFFVTSSSPIRPLGISILSENTYQGSLSVTGKLPFLGTVSLEGTLPSYGSGTVNYNCGSGNVAILSENSPCIDI